MVFVIDMSSSIWVEFFKEQMKFVADLVDNFDIDSGKTQVNQSKFSFSEPTYRYFSSKLLRLASWLSVVSH